MIELVRQGYEAWNSGDRQWVLDHMTEDVEWHTPPEDPDPGVFRGHEGVVQFWDQWRELFGQMRFRPEDVTAEGNHVVVNARRMGRGSRSGVEITERVSQVFRFTDEGKCDCVKEFYDESHALAAAGIAKAASHRS